MAANGVTNLHLAEILGRNDGYVSERANGKRPLDTDDVDALARTVPGWTGKSLMIELAQRARVESAPSNVTRGAFGVGALGEDRKVARPRETEPTDEQ